METISQTFSELYDKILIRYQNNSERSRQIPDLSASDEQYINFLYELDQPTLTSFAEKSQISKPAATRIIQRFLKKGYLSKQPSSQDKRVSYLHLSQQLRAYCQNSYHLFNQVFLQTISVLSPAERTQLEYLIKKVNEKI
ncbi:MarR family winged helix-turn-helix transcriptional regulator [Oenococcus sp.]|uniref:MarR family winged helix-turn-helix transcriptional regulator n=1 Tax=Oenococcus sp. TaxID=1979414 RepID=UPI0039EA8D77